jgi:hypothetical protein
MLGPVGIVGGAGAGDGGGTPVSQRGEGVSLELLDDQGVWLWLVYKMVHTLLTHCILMV